MYKGNWTWFPMHRSAKNKYQSCLNGFGWLHKQILYQRRTNYNPERKNRPDLYVTSSHSI